MAQRQDYNIMIKRDGKFYVGYCLEIPQARGQGSTRTEAIQDTKQAIKLCKSYLEIKKKSSGSKLVTVSV
jgi:predicted RNase H-like HicB family nuclease